MALGYDVVSPAVLFRGECGDRQLALDQRSTEFIGRFDLDEVPSAVVELHQKIRHHVGNAMPFAKSLVRRAVQESDRAGRFIPGVPDGQGLFQDFRDAR